MLNETHWCVTVFSIIQQIYSMFKTGIGYCKTVKQNERSIEPVLIVILYYLRVVTSDISLGCKNGNYRMVFV